MSISTTRNLLEKSGCGVIVAVALGVVMLVGLVAPSCSAPGQPNARESQSPVVMTIGKTDIRSDQLDAVLSTAIQQQEQQMTAFADPNQPSEGITGRDRMSITATTLRRQAEEGLVLAIADDLGIEINDDVIMKTQMADMDRRIQDARAQLVSSKKLKPNAPQTEVDALFKTEFQNTPAEIRTRVQDEITQGLTNPGQNLNLRIATASRLLIDRYGKDISPSDEEVKASFDEFVLKSIRFGPKPGLTGSPAELAKKAKEEITKGMSFEAAITKYSVDVAPPDKKLSEVTQNAPRRQLQTSPSLKSVVALKPGMVSEPITGPQGVVLIKVQAINRNLPADFEQMKAIYRRQLIDELASARVAEEREKKRSANLIKWNDLGLKSLYEAQVLVTEISGTPEEQRKELTTFLENLKEPEMKNGVIFSRNAMSLARFLVTEKLYRSSDNVQQQGVREKFVEALTGVLEDTPDPGLRLTMVDQLVAMKSKTAGEQLLNAASENSFYGAMGLTFHAQINTFLETLTKEQLIDNTTAEKVKAEQKRWENERTEILAELAADKKAREEAEKRLEAEKKAAEEAANKEAEGAKKDAAPSASDLTQPNTAPAPTPIPGTAGN